jgi:hypothetical protein
VTTPTLVYGGKLYTGDSIKALLEQLAG